MTYHEEEDHHDDEVNDDDSSSGDPGGEDGDDTSSTSTNNTNEGGAEEENEQERMSASEQEDGDPKGGSKLKNLSMMRSGMGRKPANKRIKLTLRKLPLPTLAKSTLRKLPTLANNKLPTLANNKLPTLANSKLPTLANSKLPTLANSKMPSLANSKLPLANRRNKLPKSKSTTSNATSDEEEDSDNDEVNATVVDSDEDGDEDDAVAVATAVPVSAEKGKQSTGRGVTSANAESKQQAAKRRAPSQTKPLKMPPISSPGLLVVPSSNTPKTDIQNGYVTAASIFDYHMEQAGYTAQARSKRAHRGSSVKREVGDMFDTNVALSLRFPPLVPPELLNSKASMNSNDDEINEKKSEISLPRLLIEALQRKKTTEETNGNRGSEKSFRKRKRPWNFQDMVPVSLTIPYPEEFIKKRLKYVEDVDRREKSIVCFQEAEEADDIADEKAADNGEENENTTRSSVTVPPIPQPPTPPALQDLVLDDSDNYKDKHPLYPPNAKDNFVFHLDEKCFHITEGRYFGLVSNWIADPNFVGPNAPGMSGLNASGGSGLATSTSGGGISGAMALTLSTTYNGTTAGAAAALKSAASTSVPKESAKKPVVVKENNDGQAQVRSKPTGTVADLKKIMDEEGGDLGKSIKDCIIRAAVHASRSGRHGQSFLAPNGEIYPDASKAFAAHAGIKPCNRCKSNKQGAYHCRLRRRHKELDHDGGNSPAILAPLFNAPMDSLLLKKVNSI